MIGSGIFRTPGLVARQLGRPWLTFVAWLLGGVLAFAGALCFAELATRHPKAGGKYVYAARGVRPAHRVRGRLVRGIRDVPGRDRRARRGDGRIHRTAAGWPPSVSKWVGRRRGRTLSSRST